MNSASSLCFYESGVPHSKAIGITSPQQFFRVVWWCAAGYMSTQKKVNGAETLIEKQVHGLREHVQVTVLAKFNPLERRLEKQGNHVYSEIRYVARQFYVQRFP